MIFKNRVFPVATVLLCVAAILRCIDNPADIPSGPDGMHVTDISNVYSGINEVVQDSKGIFYGTDGGQVFRFDAADLANNILPDTFQRSCCIEGLFIDTNDNLVICQNVQLLVLSNFDTAAYSEFTYNIDYFVNTPRPMAFDSTALWLATSRGQIFRWGGTGNVTHVSLSRSYDIKAVFPHNDSLTIFALYGERIIKVDLHDTEKAEQIFAAELSELLNVFRIGDRYFAIGIFYDDGWGNSQLFELDADGSFVVHDTLPYRGKHPFVSTGDAVYLNANGWIYKLTASGLYELCSFLGDETPSPLFLDRDKRPTLFYTPTRKTIRLDSLAGYVETVRW